MDKTYLICYTLTKRKKVFILFNLVDFANDKCRIMKCLCDNQREVKKYKIYCIITTRYLYFSKNKTNKMIQELKKDNFIDSFNNIKEKYIII
ncbi:hypothetical protein HMPREF1984_01709 [Leptotrichia sp. oral taxon 215 str. W9775]|nr:hypothetical protein HMPREF1984_01709 [Leptotrichia sp. oral taxon 215 str. W9775]